MGAELPEGLTSLSPLRAIQEEVMRLRRESAAYLRTLSEEGPYEVMPQREADVMAPFMTTPMDALRTLPIREAHHNGEIGLTKKLLGQRVEASAAT